MKTLPLEVGASSLQRLQAASKQSGTLAKTPPDCLRLLPPDLVRNQLKDTAMARGIPEEQVCVARMWCSAQGPGGAANTDV
jgi:hypothetical protein